MNPRRGRTVLSGPPGPRARGLRAAGPPISEALADLLAALRRAAGVSAPVLIQGATSLQAERLARLLHRIGPRAGGPFVRVDCGAMSDRDLERALFGQVDGIFDLALRARLGLLELACGGTIFLDEVGEVSPELQAGLVGALSRRRVRPLGADVERTGIDARVIAATGRDLDVEVEVGRFREDLYHTLAAIPIRLPPAQRGADDADVVDLASRRARRR